MRTKEVLEQINMGGKKADVYLACLETGGATAYLIAKKLGLKRPTVYDTLNQLLKEGLAYASIKKNTKYFFPSDPLKILKKAKEQEENISSIMPTLQNLYNAQKIKPSVKYFEGEEGLKELYNDNLTSLKKGDEILAYVGEDVLKHLPKHSSEYVDERVRRGIKLRGIYKNTPELMKFISKNKEQLRSTKVIDAKNFPVNNETAIYGNKIAFANYGKEMFGVIIESEEMARAQRAIFELAWTGAKNFETLK